MKKRPTVHVGAVFGTLTVVELVPGYGRSQAGQSVRNGDRLLPRAIVRCACGRFKIVNRQSLADGNTRSCGAPEHREMPPGHSTRAKPFEPGTRVGQLTVVADRGSRKVIARCDCGQWTVVTRGALRGDRRRKPTRSCGCLATEGQRGDRNSNSRARWGSVHDGRRDAVETFPRQVSA
jgi:hypothetical protein